LKLRELAERLACRLEGDGEVEIVRVAGIQHAQPGDVTFLANPKYESAMARTRASAVLLRDEAPVVPLASIRLLSPIANPGKIIAAPVNYQKHLAEVKSDVQIHANNPAHTITIQQAGVFLKASSSLVGPGEGVALRMPERRTDHEVELAVVIGRTGSGVSRAEALQYVAGYTIGLDISIRGSEDRSLRKSADSYTVLGPWLVTADEVPDPGRLDLQITVNGTLRQQSNTKNMILGVAELIELAYYRLGESDSGAVPGQPVRRQNRLFSGYYRHSLRAIAAPN